MYASTRRSECELYFFAFSFPSGIASIGPGEQPSSKTSILLGSLRDFVPRQVIYRRVTSGRGSKAVLGLQAEVLFLPVTDMSPQQIDMVFAPAVEC